MCKLFTILAVLIMSASLTAPTFAGPCSEIAKACSAAGYYKGGNTVGKGLILDCILPIAEGSKSLPGKSFNASSKSQCAALIHEKMGQQ